MVSDTLYNCSTISTQENWHNLIVLIYFLHWANVWSSLASEKLFWKKKEWERILAKDISALSSSGFSRASWMVILSAFPQPAISSVIPCMLTSNFISLLYSTFFFVGQFPLLIMYFRKCQMGSSLENKDSTQPHLLVSVHELNNEFMVANYW